MKILDLMNKYSTVIVFGAGIVGTYFSEFILEETSGKISCFCDNSLEKQGKPIYGIPVYSFEEASRLFPEAAYIIAVNNPKTQDEIKFSISSQVPADRIFRLSELSGITISVKRARENVAAGHVVNMDSYFEAAEQEVSLNRFWAEDSPFYKMFSTLDLENTVELACGRGRHVSKYMDQAKHIILIDILEKNIELCKKRFSGNPKIQYYKNNGYDLSEISDSSVSALFTYDAMVHFELMDIYSYLLETSRILRPGGKALFHHSNNYSDYNATFTNAVNGRAFMSDKIFAHLATRAGLIIIEQKIIDWGEPNLDCITLLCK